MTPSKPKRACGLLGDWMPQAARKTRSSAEGRSKKGRFYKPLPKEFRRHGFNYRRIAREGDAALYEQRWTGCAEPSLCYEVIRIRWRDGFRIGEKFIEPYQVYPNSDAWGADGFTFTNRNKAWAKFLEIPTLKEVQIEDALHKEKTPAIL
jgi:hypothetical protein